jgi:hypothetical protein
MSPVPHTVRLAVGVIDESSRTYSVIPTGTPANRKLEDTEIKVIAEVKRKGFEEGKREENYKLKKT